MRAIDPLMSVRFSAPIAHPPPPTKIKKSSPFPAQKPTFPAHGAPPGAGRRTAAPFYRRHYVQTSPAHHHRRARQHPRAPKPSKTCSNLHKSAATVFFRKTNPCTAPKQQHKSNPIPRHTSYFQTNPPPRVFSSKTRIPLSPRAKRTQSHQTNPTSENLNSPSPISRYRSGSLHEADQTRPAPRFSQPGRWPRARPTRQARAGAFAFAIRATAER